MIAALLEAEIWEALERVWDPCSVATRSPLNIVDMGLVRTMEVDEDANVTVKISPTAPSCILIASIVEAAEKEVEKVPGVNGVRASIESEFFWTPEEMTAKGTEMLAEYRREREKNAPVPLGRKRAAGVASG